MLSGIFLACGPYFHFDPTGILVSLAILLVFKPASYFAFIEAFRYRVSRPVPMTFRQAFNLAAIRTGLGILLIGGGALLFSALPQEFWLYSWIYLYGHRALVWAWLGWRGAALRGRRWAGWTISGTLLDTAFDALLLFGLFTGPIFPVVILLAIFAAIWMLREVGQRQTLKSRFTSDPLCAKCEYNLTGNLSGICPECGTPVAVSIQAAAEDGVAASSAGSNA